jgi:polyisoprenoid-binding protein YceI
MFAAMRRRNPRIMTWRFGWEGNCMNLKLISGAAAAAGLLFAGASSAQMGASHDPSAVEAGTYAVEPGHTEVLFDVDHLGFTKYYGQFSGVSGTLTLDPRSIATSSVSVTIPTASITAPNDKLTGELRSPMFLDAATYPTITFVSRQVTQTGPTTAKITGDLTLHGVTHTVTLDAAFHGAGINGMSKKYNLGFDLTGHFKRSDFGVNTYLPVLGDDVEVIIAAAFVKTS